MSPRDLGNSVRQKSRAFRPPARTWENSVRQKSRVFRPPRGPGKILSPQNHVTWSRQAMEAWLPTRQCELQDNASSLAYIPQRSTPRSVCFAANENRENSVPKKTRHFQPCTRARNPIKFCQQNKNLTFTPPAQETGKCKSICLSLCMSSSIHALIL